MNAANQHTTPVPDPFLGPLFEPGIEPVIATGFKYHPEEVALHGVETHSAIDMDLPRGTPILAPADGFYLATYGEVLTRKSDGSARKLGLAQASKANPLTSLHPPSWSSHTSWPVWFGSFVIQGWHERGRYTQYAHVDWVEPSIPYFPPVEQTDDKGAKTGDLKHSPVLRYNVDDYKKLATFIGAGQIIGVVGMTGCGWGKRCYDFAQFDKSGRPDFRGADYTFYTSPHLHFATFGRRAPYTRDAKVFDPFGIYGQREDGYPKRRGQWQIRQPHAKHQPLWVAQ